MQQLRKLLLAFQKLPGGWIKANVHSSLLITLAVIVLAILVASGLQPGLLEIRSLALSLPMVWVVSLAVRTAAQHLSIGEDSLEFKTRLGPTGNISTDYEFLRPSQILKYSVAGHSATLFLVVLGMVITAASLPTDHLQGVGVRAGFGSAAQWDVYSGWGSLAWASQIMWVNLIIGALNLLPTVPFDNRALLYGLLMLNRKKAESIVHWRLAVFDSHLSMFLIGISCATLAYSAFQDIDSIGWYAFAAAGVYLFVAGRWEMSRVHQLEDQTVQLSGNVREKTLRPALSKHRRSVTSPSGSVELTEASITKQNSATETSVEAAPVVCQERRMHVSEAYLDEILRKLHREGTGSLSVREQEALLTASEKLKEKHRTK